MPETSRSRGGDGARAGLGEALWAAVVVLGALLLGPLLWVEVARRAVDRRRAAGLESGARAVCEVVEDEHGWRVTLTDGETLRVGGDTQGTVYEVFDGRGGFAQAEARPLLTLRVDGAAVKLCGSPEGDAAVWRLVEDLRARGRVRGPRTLLVGGMPAVWCALPGTALWVALATRCAG